MNSVMNQLCASKMIYHRRGEPERACITVLSWRTNHG